MIICMKKFLIDTCVISEMVKDIPHPRVSHWVKTYDPSFFYISVMTLGELKHGIYKLPSSSEKRKKLEAWVESDVRSFFQNRVLEISIPIAEKWGMMIAEVRKSISNVPPVDFLLAATAQIYGLEVATRNVKDFKIMNVPLFNPWEDSL